MTPDDRMRMTTLRDDDAAATPTTPAPWDTPQVGNTEDAIEAAKRRDDAERERIEAIKRMRLDDGMTYRAIAQALGMTERNVQFIVSGKPRSARP